MSNNVPVLSSVLGHTDVNVPIPRKHISSTFERFAPIPKNTTATTSKKVEVGADAKRPTKGKRVRRAEPKQQTAFRLFPRLPAELRIRIWTIALKNQIEQASESFYLDVVHPIGNSVIIHEHKVKDRNKQLSVVSTSGYPTLFFVNREARYEAAKFDGGAWYALGVGALQVYANVRKDQIYFALCCSSPGLQGSPLQSKGSGIFCIVDF